MRLRAALVAVALLAVVGACGGSAASPGQSASASLPAVSFALPSAAPPSVEPTLAPTTQPATGTTYTVKKGDTLWAIALKYKTTIKAIQDANPSLTNPDVLKIGQKLVIPAP